MEKLLELEKLLETNHFICWPIHSIDTDNIDKANVQFMYMKMTDDGMAEFYQDFELKSMKISFKTKRLCSPSAVEALCFETDITDELRSWLKQFIENNIEINGDESKIQLTFHQDGTMGHVL